GRDTFAIMCIDVDRFKEVNDVFGHAAGDALLREVAARLKSVAGEAFLARFGGDEFNVITPLGVGPVAISALGEQLLAAVSDEIDIGGHGLRVGVSIGVAVFPPDGIEETALLGNADAALYRAKREGRGTIRFFEADMDRQLREKRAMQH